MSSPTRGLEFAAGLRECLRGLAPETVVVGARQIRGDDEADLMDEERDSMTMAVLRRRHEFASGRALLRELLDQRIAIPVASDRSPRLPPGVCGSLAHDDFYVIAAISADQAVRAIGVDLEPIGPLEDEVAAIIRRPDDAPLDARLLFTLKEAAYKAWSSLGGRMLDHQEMQVTTQDSSFAAHVADSDVTLAGRFGTASGRFVALVVVDAAQRHGHNRR